jgi:hypothetical protein
MLRTESGRDPDDRALTDLVGELCTRSEAFDISPRCRTDRQSPGPKVPAEWPDRFHEEATTGRPRSESVVARVGPADEP